MAVTLFGIVYGTGSAQIRRYIYPTANNSEIVSQANLGPGESLTNCSIGPYPNAAAWQNAVNTAVTTAAGKAPGDPRSAVISSAGNVVGVILADPAIDSVAGMTLISASQANIGWKWTSSGGFASPPPSTAAKP